MQHLSAFTYFIADARRQSRLSTDATLAFSPSYFAFEEHHATRRDGGAAFTPFSRRGARGSVSATARAHFVFWPPSFMVSAFTPHFPYDGRQPLPTGNGRLRRALGFRPQDTVTAKDTTISCHAANAASLMPYYHTSRHLRCRRRAARYPCSCHAVSYTTLRDIYLGTEARLSSCSSLPAAT